VNPWAADSVKTWWEGGAELARERSMLLYEQMKKAQKEGRNEDAAKAQRGLRALGILALETLFEKLEAGDQDALAVIKEILRDDMQVSGKDEVLQWWRKNRGKYTMPKASTKPSEKCDFPDI